MSTTSPRILTLDLESSPNIAHVWGLFKQSVSLNQLMESTRVISFAAKWYGKKEVLFYSEHHDGHEEMIRIAWTLIDQADVVVHFNGKTFDMPHLRREFLKLGLTPPSPVQEIDLLTVAKGRFRFTSNKLDYVSQYVGLEGKVSHQGHTLWVKCMAGDDKAWSEMRKYNKYDVVLTEQLYDILRPWITGHPHMGLFSGELHSCQRCGGSELTKQGFAYTLLGKFQQYRCAGCGSWSRGKTNLQMQDERGIQ